MKKYLLGLITGIIVVGGIGVIAYTYNASQISYSPRDTTWEVDNVKAAIDDLKSNGTSKKVCSKVSGEDFAVGSKYECNPSLDGETKYNFYVLRVEGNAVRLIMERNITDTVGSSRTMNWGSAMNFFRNGSGKNLGWKVAVGLPEVQDIADAVGNTSWNTAEKNYDGWFYFDKYNGSYGQTQVANASNPSGYQWLYNYSRECSAYGCDANTSLDSNYAYGYWTGDIIALQKDTTARAWGVGRGGGLGDGTVSSTTGNGVRPVITILKSNVS